MRNALRGLLLAAALASLPLLAAVAETAPDPAALLASVDANEVYSSISYEGEMTIEYQGRRYVKTFLAWGSGAAQSFIEFTNPEDLGTKYLKTEGRLYVYSPESEEIMLISGHLLKESMMGSDLSYEDTIGNEKLSSRYAPAIAGEEGIDGRRAWILELKALRKTESYPRQRLWIDAATGEVLRQELYALSGAKLKEYRLLRSELIGGRRFPVQFEMRDLLRKGSRTSFLMKSVRLDAPIPPDSFSLKRLGR